MITVEDVPEPYRHLVEIGDRLDTDKIDAAWDRARIAIKGLNAAEVAAFLASWQLTNALGLAIILEKRGRPIPAELRAIVVDLVAALRGAADIFEKASRDD